MKKRLLSFVIIFVMTLGFFPALTFAATTDFHAGSGTETDPFLIATKEHLNNVRYYTSAHFKLLCDIEFSDADFAEGGAFYNNGTGFTPIDQFTGVFDGNGFAIKNIYIYQPKNDASFMLYNKGIIKNLGMVDGTITAGETYDEYYNAAGIALRNNKEIKNCYNTSNVTSLSEIAGGIVAYNNGGTISDCYNTGDISSISDCGGIVGFGQYECTIQNCYNLGRISA